MKNDMNLKNDKDIKSNKIADAYDLIKFDDAAKQRVWKKVPTDRYKKRRVLPMLSATAAVLIVILLVYILIPAQTGNSFTASAYVPGFRADGTTERIELDIQELISVEEDDEQPADRSMGQIGVDMIARVSGLRNGYTDGENFYFTIAFDIKGDNIRSVEFYTDIGFFAKQQIDYDNVLISDRDDSGNLISIMFGTEFIPLGDRISLEDMKSADYSFAIAVPFISDFRTTNNLPSGSRSSTMVLIDVLFNNGEKQQRAINISTVNLMNSTYFHKEFGTVGATWLAILDITNATLIPESVLILPFYDDINGRWGEDMYVWEREQGDIFIGSQLLNSFGIDPDFEQRYGPYRVNGKVIMPLIRLNENGDFVAMEYILPDDIARILLSLAY